MILKQRPRLAMDSWPFLVPEGRVGQFQTDFQQY